MTKRASNVIGYLIWFVCLVPVALLAIWLEMTEASWRGFFIALGGLMVFSVAFELVYSGVAWLLRRRSARSDTPAPDR